MLIRFKNGEINEFVETSIFTYTIREETGIYNTVIITINDIKLYCLHPRTIKSITDDIEEQVNVYNIENKFIDLSDYNFKEYNGND